MENAALGGTIGSEKGAFATLCPALQTSPKINVNEFVNDMGWDMQKLQATLLNWMLQHIVKIDIEDRNKPDFITGQTSTDGQFSNYDAWQSVRKHN